MAANRELDMIKVDARKMAIDIVHYVPKYQTPPDPSDPGKTMRRTVDEMIVKHEIKFKSMIQHLVKNLDFPVDAEEDSQNMIKRTFDGVVHAMFSDEKITWGRIVALYAFGGLVAKHCVQNNMQDYVDFCGDLVADHVCDYLFRWILHKGGWSAFEDYFDKGMKMEERIWRGLLVVGGIGAVALGVIAVR